MERLAFTVAPQLLLDVVKRQTGSLSKALIEGIMNGIEAGASRVDVMIETDRVRIVDDGAGFESREAIERCFGTFGQPHGAEEKKIWANFRMGRGQLFSFGRNRWKTNGFEMTVDIESTLCNSDLPPGSLGYSLAEGLPHEKGCTIEVALYEPLEPWTVNNVRRETAQQVKYCKTRVFVNGEMVSTDPGKKKWDIETEDGHVRFLEDHRGMRVYNLGVYVQTIYHEGISGEVVSKKQLTVNFARNEVMSSCPVWKNLRKLLRQKAEKTVIEKTRLNDEERRHVIGGLLDGVYTGSKVWRCELFPDTSGKHWSPSSLSRAAFTAWSFGEKGSRAGDRAMQMGLGVVIDRAVLDMFGICIKDESRFFEEVANRFQLWTQLSAEKYMTLEDLLKGIDDSMYLVPLAKYSKREKLLLGVAGEYIEVCLGAGGRRSLVIGESETADGWTDGASFIAVNRFFLRKVEPSVAGFTRLSFLLLHEVLHAEPDTGNHIHSPDFFQAYHDLTDKAIQYGERMYLAYAHRAVRTSATVAKRAKREAAVAEADSSIAASDVALLTGRRQEAA